MQSILVAESCKWLWMASIVHHEARTAAFASALNTWHV